MQQLIGKDRMTQMCENMRNCNEPKQHNLKPERLQIFGWLNGMNANKMPISSNRENENKK